MPKKNPRPHGNSSSNDSANATTTAVAESKEMTMKIKRNLAGLVPRRKIAVSALARIYRLCWQDWIDQPSFCLSDVLSRIKLRIYRSPFW